jgi:hypothetical protein
MIAIVTRENLQQMLDNADTQRRIQIVGRALVVLFNRQTEVEQQTNETNNLNGVGFTGADGHSGCLTAKSFLKNRTLADWQVERWLKKDKNGFARLVKYHKQLNEAAEAKRAVA